VRQPVVALRHRGAPFLRFDSGELLTEHLLLLHAQDLLDERKEDGALFADVQRERVGVQPEVLRDGGPGALAALEVGPLGVRQRRADGADAVARGLVLAQQDADRAARRDAALLEQREEEVLLFGVMVAVGAMYATSLFIAPTTSCT
jgi:hypothetical protein